MKLSVPLKFGVGGVGERCRRRCRVTVPCGGAGWRPAVTVRVSPFGVGVVGQHAGAAAIVDGGVLGGGVGVVDGDRGVVDGGDGDGHGGGVGAAVPSVTV